jgi:hypothetical protein
LCIRTKRMSMRHSPRNGAIVRRFWYPSRSERIQYILDEFCSFHSLELSGLVEAVDSPAIVEKGMIRCLLRSCSTISRCANSGNVACKRQRICAAHRPPLRQWSRRQWSRIYVTRGKTDRTARVYRRSSSLFLPRYVLLRFPSRHIEGDQGGNGGGCTVT